jgi:uncharacterized protein GlcG (DUF336 family)
LIKKSFVACGQVKNANLEDVTCMKPGRPIEGAMEIEGAVGVGGTSDRHIESV